MPQCRPKPLPYTYIPPKSLIVIVFSCETTANSGVDRLTVEVSRLHTIRHRHTPRMTPPDEWPARRRGQYLHKTQLTQQTKIHSLSGFQTLGPCNRAAVDLCLKVHYHRDGVVILATRYGMDGPEFRTQGSRNFPQPSRRTLGPNQPPVQWIPDVFSGSKAAGVWRWPLTEI